MAGQKRKRGNHQWEAQYDNDWCPAKDHEALSFLGLILGNGESHVIKLNPCKCGVTKIEVKPTRPGRTPTQQVAYYVQNGHLTTTAGPCSLELDGID